MRSDEIGGSGPMRRLAVVCCVSMLLACAQHSDGEPGGSGGAAAASGSGSAGGSGGASGTSGSGGVGGCANGAACPGIAGGWFATKTLVDVWWPSASIVDPGRGTIEFYQLVRLDGNGDSDTSSTGIATSKVCGVTLPVFTSDVACDPYELSFADAMWDRPTMPRFTTQWSVARGDADTLLALQPITELLGVDLLDDHVDHAWSPSDPTTDWVCEGGTGVACLVDHDDDDHPGLTGTVRLDQTAYSYDDVDQGGVVRAIDDVHYGNCTNGTPYKYRGIPTSIDINCGGCSGAVFRAAQLYLGMRVRTGNELAAAGDWARSIGNANADVNLRARDCEVDPASVYSESPRGQSMDYACNPSESSFVDSAIPAFRVLDAGEIPGDARPPPGWEQIGRDIDKRASVGSRVAMARLAHLTEAEPTCVDVRAATYPVL